MNPAQVTVPEPAVRRSNRLAVGLTVLALALVAGCATHPQHRYAVLLSSGQVIRAVAKPKLDKDGFYFVKDEAGRRGTIHKSLVVKIVEEKEQKTKSDKETFAETAKSAKPSGKPNFRDSFEFR